LGFQKSKDIPMGGEHRWLTVTAPEGIEGMELLLEPLGFPPAVDYQKTLFESGIPYFQFESNDIETEVASLKEKGVVFRGDIKEMGDVKMVIFEDTCGNLICLTQQTG
jgi:hypothetical protein